MQVRRLEQADLRARVSWLNSPEVYTQMVVDLPISEAGTQQWFSQIVLSNVRRDFTFTSGSDDYGDDLVAMGGLTDIHYRNGNAELYIVVNPKLLGQGIGTRAVRWLCNFGFLRLNLERIYLYTMSANDGARRLYERLGFVEEGILRNHLRHLGCLVDRHVHGLLRSEWETQAWSIHDPLKLDRP